MEKTLFISLFCIIGIQLQGMGEDNSQITIQFCDNQKRVIDKKYVMYAPTLKNMLVCADDSAELVMPEIVNPKMWDVVVEPTLTQLDGVASQKHYMSWAKGQISGMMNRFHDKSEDKAIMESANIFDFLGLDELLDYEIFKQICFLYEIRNMNSSYSACLQFLNLGLAEKIYATKPVPKPMMRKTLGGGYRWHEISYKD